MVSPEVNPEGPSGIGEELRQARIRRGSSIAQAQRATRIARHYLEALEAEEWSRLPDAPFARGFLSSYAQFLGLDEGPLLARFPLQATLPGEGLQLAGETADSQPVAERQMQPRGELRAPGVNVGPWLVAAVVVLVIIGAVAAVVGLRNEVEPVSEERDVPGIANVDDALATSTSGPPANSDFDPLPDLSLYSSREAISFIKLLNAPYVVVSVYDDSPLGTVLEQSPRAGVQPPEDAVITLVVSRGPRPIATQGTQGSSEPAGTTDGS